MRSPTGCSASTARRVDPDALRRLEARSPPLLAPAFAVQLVHRLRDQDPKITPALLWLEEKLAAAGHELRALLQEEHLRQGASNVTVRNIITSMRLMSDVDWAEFFESVSLVDEALNTSANFAAMDFATRNLYRNAIEELGRGSQLSELEIAQLVLRHRGRRDNAARTRSGLPPDRRRPAHSSSAPSASTRRGATGRAASRSPSARATTSPRSRSPSRAGARRFPLSMLQQAGVARRRCCGC